MNKCIISAFKKVRKDNELTQAQLSEVLGVSAGHIGTIEQGKTRPSHELMEKIVELYGLDANLFFIKKGKPISADIAKSVKKLKEKVQQSYDQFNNELDMIIQEIEILEELNDE